MDAKGNHDSPRRQRAIGDACQDSCVGGVRHKGHHLSRRHQPLPVDVNLKRTRKLYLAEGEAGLCGVDFDVEPIPDNLRMMRKQRFD